MKLNNKWARGRGKLLSEKRGCSCFWTFCFRSPLFITPLRSLKLFAFLRWIWSFWSKLPLPGCAKGRRVAGFVSRVVSTCKDSLFFVSTSGTSVSPSPEGLEIVNYFLWKRQPAALRPGRFAKNSGYRLFLKTVLEESWPWVTFLPGVCLLRENHTATSAEQSPQPT